MRESNVLNLEVEFDCFDYSIRHWAAIRTAAKWEKKLAETLKLLGTPVFLPVIHRVTKYKTRVSRATIPLFSGYLFFDESRLANLSDLSPESKRFVAQVLRTQDHKRLYEDLCKIADLLKDRRLIEERIYGREGDPVRIKAGPFQDHNGVIKAIQHQKQRITLSVAYLGASVEVEIDSAAVEKL